MASTRSDFGNMANPFHYQDSTLKNMASKLYKLKAKFERKYYKLSGCRKYDMARDFNIELSATLYQVNQMLNFNEANNVSFNYQKIDTKINSLEQELSSLIS